MSKTIQLLLLFILPFTIFTPAFAQTVEPDDQEPENLLGEVSGTIMNKNLDSPVAESLDIMLHGWGQTSEQQVMLHGQSENDGTFLFTDVEFEIGYSYVVMATFEDAAYYSDPVSPTPGESLLSVDVAVYESTTEPSNLRIEQMHILLYAAQGGLGISEVYILSNLGDKTFANADDVANKALQFSLPTNAANVSFESNTQERFTRIPDGFVDTAPIIPGIGSNQIAVSYILEYSDGMSYSVTPPIEVLKVNVIVEEGLGISLQGDRLVSDGSMELQGGGLVSLYSHEGLASGDSLTMNFVGELQRAAQAIMPTTSEAVTSQENNKGIAFGLTAVGLGLVGFGYWWLKRPLGTHNGSDEEEAIVAEIITEIADLDESHNRGEISQADYSRYRKRLIEEAKHLM
ncbi:MAG: hypothetical protein DWQ07_18625 [Chloroflexi bacterium]|nr:MAG: hypothetical protein DWQ07_18625 [Chloroflexota bacterium]MBL1194947.1 hypothetical protein [Chloroflexota bacterium]NOH12237.1 hypothetical protein [Chloroflexota bacterium]